MSVKFTVQNIGDVTILDAEGRITLGEGSSALRDIIRDEVNKGAKKFVLNVAGVNYFDSSGVGELVSGSVTVRNRGGEIKLVALNTRTRELLLNTKLYDNFDIHEETGAAIRCFGGEHIGCSLKRL